MTTRDVLCPLCGYTAPLNLSAPQTVEAWLEHAEDHGCPIVNEPDPNPARENQP